MNTDYLELLEHSFTTIKESGLECPPESRFEYLAEFIFNFNTYDSEMSDLFGRKAVEVCVAINNKKTFDYISDQENYKWFLLMCNMPFFTNKIEWGTSIRGAFWSAPYRNQVELDSCGLWIGDEQHTKTMTFSKDEWEKFISAMVDFANKTQEK